MSEDWIASREFNMGVGRCVVTVGKPRYISLEDAWVCTYQLRLPGRLIEREAIGIDSVQALTLALVQLGTTAYTSESVKTTSPVWLDSSDPGYLGLPVFADDENLVPGGSRMRIVL